jgi:hypothetical protein
MSLAAKTFSAQDLVTLYNVQKGKAKKLGVDWELSFDSWYALWSLSGKLDQRGNKGNEYSLTRRDSSKGFSTSNCIIRTNSENAADKSAEEIAASTANIVAHQNKLKAENKNGKIHTPAGIFSSTREAAIPNNLSFQAIDKKIKNAKETEFYRVYADGTRQEKNPITREYKRAEKSA